MYFAEMVEQYRADRRRNSPQETQIQPGHLHRVLRWLMPNGGTLLLVALLVATAQVWAKPLASPASAPGPSATTVNYQGRLANPDGPPVTDNNYGMTFALYDASTGGNLVRRPESHAAVPVADGLLSVGLGSQTSGGIPTSTWNGDRYLEITVGGETLSPRELIRSVPIAGMALTVPDGAITSSKLKPTIAYASPAEDVPLSSCPTETTVLEVQVSNDFDATYLVWASVMTRVNENDRVVEARLRLGDGTYWGGV